ncbi:hypothetical protein [Microbacterium sp.]|uniref:hypothetical protein n=1 Tax=Microbacterium sp. TaxID=51671 RepID=UPI003F968A31
MADDKRTARELIQDLRGRGLSNTEIASELQRSPRMVRKVLNGETSGAAYTQTLRELASTGRASTVPPRRRSKDGNLVPVRTKAGAAEKSAPPVDTGGRYTSERQGGRFTATTYLGGGGRQHEIKVPKGKTTKGRGAATADLLTKVRSAARGQSKDTQKRVRLQVTYANGRVMEVNDYNASTLLKRMNEQGGRDPLGWLAAQSAKRYANLDTSKTPITGVTMTVYDSPRSDRSSRDYRPRNGN